MSDDVRPLPVFPWPLTEHDREALKQAKIAANVPFKVLPRPAVPGSPVRILTIRTPLNFIADHAVINNTDNPEAVLAAMRWALDDANMDERAVYVIDMLRGLLGPDVNEVSPERLAYESISERLDIGDRKTVSFK